MRAAKCACSEYATEAARCRRSRVRHLVRSSRLRQPRCEQPNRVPQFDVLLPKLEVDRHHLPENILNVTGLRFPRSSLCTLTSEQVRCVSSQDPSRRRWFRVPRALRVLRYQPLALPMHPNPRILQVLQVLQVLRILQVLRVLRALRYQPLALPMHPIPRILQVLQVLQVLQIRRTLRRKNYFQPRASPIPNRCRECGSTCHCRRAPSGAHSARSI